MEAAFSAIAKASLQSQVSYAVVAKALGTVRQQGDAAVALLAAAGKVQEAALESGREGGPSISDDRGGLDVTA